MRNDTRACNIAIFADFENVAIGAEKANYDRFDMTKVIERILVKGSVVVRKAYCDWGRYEKFKRGMHEENFELIDVPHVRQSGKNSADIRMVVDALDLCYTKPHIDTFVIVSGDSDFSPLVSKLRENDKDVVGVGVKQSTSDLFVSNCDEFIFYDDLVREKKETKKQEAKKQPDKSNAKAGENGGAESAAAIADRRDEAVQLVMDTLEAMSEARSEDEMIWGSMVKQAIKRKRPGFAERYYGFRGFNALLEEVQSRGLVQLQPDEKSGGYRVRSVD